jgi:hypothetical protein
VIDQTIALYIDKYDCHQYNSVTYKDVSSKAVTQIIVYTTERTGWKVHKKVRVKFITSDAIDILVLLIEQTVGRKN